MQTGKTTRSFHVQMLDRPRTISDIAAEAGASKTTARQWIKSLGNRVCEGLTRPRIYWIRELEDARNALESGSACQHDWHKVSLVTHEDGYDVMKCRKCAVTGKRHGIGRGIVVDAVNLRSGKRAT